MTEDLTDQICFDRVVRQRDEARKRIEQLEAALREIDTIAINHTKGGIGKAQSIARKALEGKDE